MMNKKFYSSKILWVNLAGVITIMIPQTKEIIEKILEPETMMVLGNLVTMALRAFWTKANLVTK